MEKRVDQHAGLQIQKTILETEIKTSPALFRVKVGCAILFSRDTILFHDPLSDTCCQHRFF